MNFPSSRAWILAGLWVWTGLVYSYVFRCGFVQDDQEIVFAHIAPREEGGWEIFKRGWWRESLGSTPVSGDHYRPIALLGFKINHMLAGLRAPFWHGVNLLIHLINIGLFFTVVERLSGRVLIAGIASGFWAVFPTNVEVVASIIGLADLLNCWVFTCGVAGCAEPFHHDARRDLRASLPFGAFKQGERPAFALDSLWHARVGPEKILLAFSTCGHPVLRHRFFPVRLAKNSGSGKHHGFPECGLL